MIVVSLLLVVLAVVLLGLGLFSGDNGWLIASITMSLLAATTLVVRGHGSRAVPEPRGVVPAPRAAPEAAVGAGAQPRADPADEPPALVVQPADAELIARSPALVAVVDGRPRYHTPECEHLAGKDSELLPIMEAGELGFTPCQRCDPIASVLAVGEPTR